MWNLRILVKIEGSGSETQLCPWAGTPLLISLEGFHEPGAGLFIWMAAQYPEAVYHDPVPGYTILHKVCDTLAMKENEHVFVPNKCTPNVAKMWHFLISDHSLKKTITANICQFHKLANCCNLPLVREIVILLEQRTPSAYKW